MTYLKCKKFNTIMQSYFSVYISHETTLLSGLILSLIFRKLKMENVGVRSFLNTSLNCGLV